MLRRTAFAVFLVMPGAALAAPSTPEEAQRLTKLLETYVGHPAAGAPPSVTVTPEGDAYKASFDLTRMAAPLHAFGIDVVATSPYVTTLTPLPDGTWRVQRGALPQFGLTTKKGMTYSVQLLSTGSVGIFDPRIEAFAHQDNQVGGTKTSMTDGSRAQRTDLTEDGKQVIEAKGPGPGDVSSTFRQDDKTIRYQAHATAAGDPTSRGVTGTPIGNLAIAMASASSEATASHENVAALLDLWAFLVAHPSRDQLVAEQPRLKSLLLAMIPYVAAFAGHTDGQGLSMDFGNGNGATVGSLGEAVAFDGASTTEGLSLSIRMKDIAVTAPALPAWIVAALPRRFDLGLATSPLDIGKALRVLVEHADVARDDPFPPDAMALSMAALAPDGGPTLAIKPSSFANDTMSLALLGAFSATGRGKARIEAKGLDQEITTIAGAVLDDPSAAQAVQILSVARALAVPQADGRLLWEIVVDASGVSVNGKPLQ